MHHVQSVVRAIALLFIISCLSVFAAPLEVDGNITNSTSEDGDLGKANSGVMTWFWPGLGNCGQYDTADSMIVALQTSMYAGGVHCGRKILITANGRSVEAVAKDSCPTCGDYRNIDVSPPVFDKLVPAGRDQGVQQVTWKFIS